MWPLRILGPLGVAIKKGINYIFRETFSVDRSAPITSPIDCEAGQLWTTDVGNNISQSGGKQLIAAGRTNWTETGRRTQAITRLTGRAIYIKCTRGITGTYLIPIQIRSDTTIDSFVTALGAFIQYAGGILIGSYYAAQLPVSAYSYAAGTEYTFLLLMRSSGLFWFIKGGAYSTWTMLYVTPLGNASPIYASFSNYNATNIALDDFTAVDLPAPYNNEATWRTSQLLNPAAGTTTAHAANCVLDTTFVYNGSSYVELRFRIENSSSYWYITISTTCALFEYNGSGINRSTYVFPVAPVAGDTIRIVVIADGNTYRGYVQQGATGHVGYYPALMWTYTDPGSRAVNATQAKVHYLGGGGWTLSELNCWPAHPEIPL